MPYQSLTDPTPTQTTSRGPDLGIDFVGLARAAYTSGLWLVVLAWSIAFASTYQTLAAGPWQTGQDGHGPLIHIASFFMLLLAARKLELAPKLSRLTLVMAIGSLVVATLLIALGQSQSQPIFSTAAQIPALAGIVLLFCGWPGLKLTWFPILFLGFGVPLPGWLLDGFTQPAKLEIAFWSTELLYALDYPIAQNGAAIMIGPYQLLVKNACAGLNSLYGLLSVGTFYVYATRSDGRLRSLLLALFILPAAILANFFRVILLCLLTFHFGLDAGQGFLHETSGMVMFVLAVLAFLMFDGLLLGMGKLIGSLFKPRGSNAA